MKIIAVAIALLSVVSSQAANIIWISFHSGDNTPSGAATTAGFTRAPDVGYTELLRNSGHNVTRVVSADNATLNAAMLNAADLVILSRSNPSGHYQSDAEQAFWHGLTVPMIVLNGYLTRGGLAAQSGNVRLGFMTGNTIPDVSSNPVRLSAAVPAHPIFAGVALDGANLMVNGYANLQSHNAIIQRGISAVTGPTVAGATVLARVGTSGDGAFGNMAIAEYPTGTVMDTTGNGGPAVPLSGKRLVFLTGSRENNGLTSEGAGIFDLTADGARMFLNAVDYMAPPPTYSRAVLADGPVVYWRFSDTGTTAANSGSLGTAADGRYLMGAASGPEAPRPPQFVGFEADNTAVHLDGTDDFVEGPIGLLNNYSNMTLSAWIRRAGTQRNRTGIIGQDNLVEFGYIDNNTVQAWVDNFETPINVPTPFPDLEWDHLALVVDGAALQMTIYTNARAAGSAALPSANYNSLNSTAPFVVGGDAFGLAPGVAFNGQIDEAAVFDKALTAEQIGNHYFSAVASAPIITRQPEGTNLFEGETIVLSVGATGTPNLRYQWLYFDSPIAGQTASTLTINNALPEHSGTYAVRVENTYGSTRSSDVEVNVQPTQPPIITQEPRDVSRYAGRTATFSVTATGGASLDYQWTHEGMALANETNRTLTINNVSDANAGVYQVIVKNAVGETPSALAELRVITPAPGSYEEVVTSGNPLAYWRLGEGSGTIAYDMWGGFDGTYSNVTLAVPGGIVGDTDTAAEFNGSSSAVRTPLSLNSTPAFTTVGWLYRGADQANRTGLWGQNDKLEMGYIDNNTIQTWTDNALNISPNPFPNQQWSFLAIVSEGSPGAVRAYTNGLPAGSRTHTLPGNNNFRFNIGGGGIFDAAGNFFNGRLDEIAVYNRALTGDEIANLYFSGAAAAPIITQQPQSTNLFEGGTINVCVTAFGSAPLSYQWYYFGAPVDGQTNRCLHIPNATPGDSGDYWVVVSNPHGEVTSATASVEVMPASPPSFTQQPQSATRYAGASVTFSATAVGTEPISYQWQKNGADIPGATSSSLTLNNVQASDQGDYRVVASNVSGTVTSDTATLTVITPAAGSYEGAVVAARPIAYWRLGEASGTTAFDNMGGNHGTYNNVTLGAPGAIPKDPDTSASFDGTSSYVGTPVSLNGMTKLSMVGWIRRAADQNNRTGLFGQNDVVEFGYIDNNTIQAWVDNFNQAVNVSPNPIPNEQWGFVALTLDNGALTVHVNEDPDGTANLGSSNYGSSADKFNIGGGGIFDAIAANGNYFNGRIDEVALFDRALSTAELNDLYRLGIRPVVSITCPGNITAGNDPGQCCGTVTYEVTAVGGNPTCSPPSGSCFAVGTTTVNCSVTDGAGDTATCSFTVTVEDREDPQITCPGNTEVPPGDANGAPVTFLPTASDNCGAPAVMCSPASGSLFPVGTTTVNCTATDASGNSASCSFTVTVPDPNQPPQCKIDVACALTYPNDPNCYVVALDNQSACVVLDGSGSTDPDGDTLTHVWVIDGTMVATGEVVAVRLPVGCHSVVLVVSDGKGGTSRCEKTVCVITPCEGIQRCIELVDEANLARKNKRPFIASLKAACASFDRGSMESGMNQMNAFQNKVRAQIARSNPEEAEAFNKCIDELRAAMECSATLELEGVCGDGENGE